MAEARLGLVVAVSPLTKPLIPPCTSFFIYTMKANLQHWKMKYENEKKALVHEGYLMDTDSHPPVPSAATINLFHKLLQ